MQFCDIIRMSSLCKIKPVDISLAVSLFNMVTKWADKNKQNTFVNDMVAEKYIIRLLCHSIYLKQWVKNCIEKPHSFIGDKKETCWDTTQKVVKSMFCVSQGKPFDEAFLLQLHESLHSQAFTLQQQQMRSRLRFLEFFWLRLHWQPLFPNLSSGWTAR